MIMVFNMFVLSNNRLLNYNFNHEENVDFSSLISHTIS